MVTMKIKHSNVASSYDSKTGAGLYVLSTYKMYYLANDTYDVVEQTKLNGAYDMAIGEKNKVYVPIYGYANNVGKKIKVFKDGKVQNEIILEYTLPDKVRYNKYNKKAYIWYACKITSQEENGITVIDTVNDTVVKHIKYNNCIEDIVFTDDNKMIVSAWGVTGGDWKLDVIDLENDSIIKTISFKPKITSMEFIGNNLIYAVSTLLDEPYVYVIDYKKGKLIDKIKVSSKYRYKVCKATIKGKEYIYVIHLNIDNNEGDVISVIDPLTRKMVNKITGISSPNDLSFHNGKLLVSSWLNNKIYVLENNKIVKEIDIQKPNRILSITQ